MKKIYLSIFTLIMYFGIIITCQAASLSLSSNASTTNTVVGNTFTITFNYSSATPLGAVVYQMTYDPDKLTLISGTQSNALSYTGTQKNDSIKFTFKAKASGTTNVNFKINEAIDFDENVLQAGSTSKTITIKTQKEIENSYSKINNLKSLTVSSGTLSPEFNKNTINYNVEVENDVDKITINGTKEDSKSSITGLKEYDLEEGINKIEVKVTAQNGSSKVYTINVIRKELSPIIVKINDEEYSIVRKKDGLTAPNDNYHETTVQIEEKEVPAFINENTKTYLVGLKNKDGEIKLYKYENNNYSIYKELSFNSVILTLNDLSKIPDNYIEEKIKINDEEVTAYKNENGDYLVNGINIKTGKENLYKYDKEENTIQIYNNDLLTKIDELNNDKDNYLYVILVLGVILILTYIAILVSNVKKSNNRKKKKTIEKKEILDNNKSIKKTDSNNKNELYTKELIELLDKDLQSSNENNNINEEIEIKDDKNNQKNDKIKEDVSEKKKN